MAIVSVYKYAVFLIGLLSDYLMFGVIIYYFSVLSFKFQIFIVNILESNFCMLKRVTFDFSILVC